MNQMEITSGSENTIDISGYPSGIYILVINDDRKNIFNKILSDRKLIRTSWIYRFFLLFKNSYGNYFDKIIYFC